MARNALPPPDVMKIDCQGAEDAILKGAVKVLVTAKVLFLETWFIRGYGPKTPLLDEIIELCRGYSFSLVDLGQRFYDEKHRLYGIDAFFFANSFLEDYSLPANIPESV